MTKGLVKLVALAVAPLMIGIDMLVMSVALVPMAKTLHVNLALLQWFMSGYGVGISLTLVLAGKLSDYYGHRQAYVSGFFLFVLGSVIVASSLSPYWVIAARILQGIGGAFLLVSSLALVVKYFDESCRTQVMGIMVAMAGLGMALGPLVGGILIHFFNWRMAFWINLPIGLLAILVTMISFPKDKASEASSLAMDWLGLALLSLALLSLSVALTIGNGMGWLSPGVLALFSVSFLSVVVLIWVEKSKVPALLDFDLFRAKNFTASCIVGFLSYFIGIGWLYVISIFLQHVYHLTPLQAGLAVLPFSLGYFLTGMTTGRLVKYFSRKSLVQVGFAIAAVSTGSLAILPGTHHSMVMGVAFLLMAVGFAGIVSTSIATGLQYVPQVKVGLASGKSMMFRWLGSAIGVATCSAVFEAQSVSKGQSLLAQMPVFDRVMGEFLAILRGHLHAVNIPDPWQKLLNAAYTSGLHTTMILLCALSLFGLWVSWQFLHHD